MSQPAAPAEDSSAFLSIANRFAEARCLLAADELGVFGLLKAGPLSTGEICAKLALNEQAAPDFLNVLVALGILRRTGDDEFANSPAADRYLVPDSPGYLGSTLTFYNNSLYARWQNLAALLTRTEDAATDGNARENFSAILDDPDQARHLLAMMKEVNRSTGPALVEAVDWSGRQSVADLGGADGRHLTEIVSAHPHLRGVVFDLPQVRPFALEQIAAAGLEGRVDFHPGNFFTDEFPPADVYIFGHILHNFAPETRYALAAKAFRSLNPGGTILVVERMVDEDRADLSRLIESLHLYVVSDGGGSDYRASDCQSYLTAAGFTRTSVRDLAGAETLVVGFKEA
ncbi:methyltransferase [Micromonospora sp. RP3T]|uniref:methyltransferase n=1 Tax=Micromonospora sp. RP3T TaxID=2135446 RepID=UPI000D1682B7|nr:methyltransferase [Micromonospora sp. RP3T]PTA47669.1 methyltransferase [Micromonospora sp. RP3T]